MHLEFLRRSKRCFSVGVRTSLFFCGLAIGLPSVTALAETAPATTGGEAVLRRLTPEQYRQIITDIFGRNIVIGGRFEPGMRSGGLLAIGASRASITRAVLEQYDGMARTIAAQVFSDQHRAGLLPCKPRSESQPDADCARQFVVKVGRFLYRRPLTQDEVASELEIANQTTKTLGKFYSGVEMSLVHMLESPDFLFRDEVGEPDPKDAKAYRLSAFSKASRLSFFLWNTMPDSTLLTAAENGELDTARGLGRQVDRMLASPRLESGVRAFFGDMLQFDQFAALSKDVAIYPKFTPKATADAHEQTLRTIVDHLLAQRGDYRDLFITRKTFLTPSLGAVYSVPVAKNNGNGAPDDWTSYEFPQDDPRGAGILSQASFVALYSTSTRSSPTRRGKALREILLCEKVPDPPGNVNFTVVQDTKNPNFRTARERVAAHLTDPTCAGCHKLVDPIGLGLENFDGAGGFRKTENGAPIDSRGELDGIAFTGAVGLGRAVHDDPATTSCLVNRLFSYAVGRLPAKGETEFLKYLDRTFQSEGYRLPDLMRSIATSDAFYRISPQGTSPQEVGQ